MLSIIIDIDSHFQYCILNSLVLRFSFGSPQIFGKTEARDGFVFGIKTLPRKISSYNDYTMKQFVFRLIIFVIFLFFSSPTSAEKKIFAPNYTLLGFGGIFVNSDLAPISFNLDFKYRPSYIYGIGYNRKLNYTYSIFEFELEGILAAHTGAMSHSEAVGVAIARIPNLWGYPFSFAVGEGQSVATQNPKLENYAFGYDRGKFNFDDVESRAWLNYLMFEGDYKLPWFENSKFFVRIHHRSGIYGVYCPPTPPCGSNFVVYGFKIEL